MWSLFLLSYYNSGCSKERQTLIGEEGYYSEWEAPGTRASLTTSGPCVDTLSVLDTIPLSTHSRWKRRKWCRPRVSTIYGLNLDHMRGLTRDGNMYNIFPMLSIQIQAWYRRLIHNLSNLMTTQTQTHTHTRHLSICLLDITHHVFVDFLPIHMSSSSYCT